MEIEVNYISWKIGRIAVSECCSNVRNRSRGSRDKTYWFSSPVRQEFYPSETSPQEKPPLLTLLQLLQPSPLTVTWPANCCPFFYTRNKHAQMRMPVAPPPAFTWTRCNGLGEDVKLLYIHTESDRQAEGGIEYMRLFKFTVQHLWRSRKGEREGTLRKL
jgi:hypothetical protein